MAAPLIEAEANPTGTLSQWIGVLGGPIVWLTQFQLNYSLVPWVCTHGHRWVLHASAAFFLLLALVCGVTAWLTMNRARRRSAPHNKEEADARSYFMGWLGVATSALFALVIFAQAIPAFILDPCQD